jgi:hypothetical protein
MSGISEQTEFETDLRPTSKKPSYIAYQLSKSKDGEKTFWTKIGVGFLHKDAGGLNVEILSKAVDRSLSQEAIMGSC